MTEPRTVGYAVVGLGRISQAAMLPAFANARDSSRLAALVSGDPGKRRRLARLHGLSESDTYDYDAFEACLDRDDVDAVYIALPNHLHREYTERAAARGVHVLCEKPMAATEEECRTMIGACDDAGVKLMVAYRLHVEPVNLEVVEAAESAALGRTRLFTSTFTLQVAEDDIRALPPDLGGGALYDIGVYCINAARYLFRAEPESVWATRASRPQERFSEIAETISGVLHFPGDRLASFTCSFGAHSISSYHLIGDEGSIRLDNAYEYTGERRLTRWGGRGAGGDGEGGGPVERRIPETDQFGAQLDYFSRCILDDRVPEPDGEEGLVDVRIIRALYRAMDEGRPVELDLRRDRRPTPDMAREYPAVEAPELVRAGDPSS